MKIEIPELNMVIEVSVDHFIFNLLSDAVKELASHRNSRRFNSNHHRELVQRVSVLADCVG